MADRQMQEGDPWVKGKCYQWRDDGRWWELDEALHADKYMVALPDMLKNLPNGYFGSLFCMLLIAQEVFAEQISGLDIILKETTNAYGQMKHGSIRSSNFVQGQSGFIIKWNGDCEFNSGIFRGILAAAQINITGTVNSGTAYLLRGDSKPASIMSESGWISAGYEGLLKEIRTVASGSCLLRMYFPRINPARTGDINYGKIRIEVNGTNLSGYSWYSIGSNNWNMNIDIPNIQLASGLNTIRLYGTPNIGGNAAPNYGVFNTTFEEPVRFNV